ncbi:MAG: aminopeptidase [Bacteroidales bacterium]|nr:aminopeptidase [Bacteroidales bacterium]MBP5374618.1 aminopeptidase [Bacteroidales bacterium]
MKRILTAAAIALCCTAALNAQQRPAAPSYDYEFTTVKENPVTSIKNQYRSGTCWCFSTISFLESEVIKAKNIKDTTLYPDLSEMFIVRKAYMDRAVKYVRLDGKLNMAAGSDFGDVLDVIREHGVISQEAYSGLNYGYDLPVQGELDAVLKGYVEAVVKNPNRKLTPVWPKGFNGILDAYMGEIPEKFSVNGVSYTPESYRDALGINPDEYVSLTSFTHHPFYTSFAIEVEDNWRWSQSWNVPLDEFMAIIDNAVNQGYTVAWGGDVSEIGFTRTGLAILYDKDAKASSGSDQERWVGKADDKAAADAPKQAPAEIDVTQELRQQWFDEKTSTDDHGMHLYGTAKDQNGVKYYLIKNSWGTSGKYKGVWYMSENYVKGKTLNIVVNRNAIPKDIRKKLGIK